MDNILFLLLEYNANLHPVNPSESEISSRLGITQQAVSYRLKKLEKLGYITRDKNGISLTRTSLKNLRDIYAVLKENLNRTGLVLEGNVTSGFGEGKRYIKMYNKRLSLILGYNLFLGTLNVKLGNPEIRRKLVVEASPISISDFYENGSHHGGLFLFRCNVFHGNIFTEGFIVIPLKTKHGYNVIEVISQFNLRKKLKLKDGDKIKIVLINSSSR